jgi:hypothetical protein
VRRQACWQELVAVAFGRSTTRVVSGIGSKLVYLETRHDVPVLQKNGEDMHFERQVCEPHWHLGRSGSSHVMTDV